MTGYYVQVRYPDHLEWVTIDVTEDRRGASALAGGAFRHSTNSRGQAPTQVRVISTPDLVRGGGQEAISRAAVDLWTRQKPVVAGGN